MLVRGGQAGIEPATSRALYENHATRPLTRCMHPVGFEPTPPKRLRPERSALDQLGHECLCEQKAKLPWLSRQSGRLLTDRSPVRARVGAQKVV